MNLIQIILILALAILLIYLFSNPGSHQIKAWKKIGSLLFVVIAIIAILIPSFLNKIAHSVGVGRGADLLLYILTLAFIFLVFNVYIKNQEEQKKIIKLARKIALLEARLNNEADAKHKSTNK